LHRDQEFHLTCLALINCYRRIRRARVMTSIQQTSMLSHHVPTLFRQTAICHQASRHVIDILNCFLRATISKRSSVATGVNFTNLADSSDPKRLLRILPALSATNTFGKHPTCATNLRNTSGKRDFFLVRKVQFPPRLGTDEHRVISIPSKRCNPKLACRVHAYLLPQT